jgi:hypothetical protein
MKYKNTWKRFSYEPEFFECTADDIVLKVGDALVIKRPNPNNDFSYMVPHHIVIESLCVQVVRGFCRSNLVVLIEEILGRDPNKRTARNAIKKLHEHSKNPEYWNVLS